MNRKKDISIELYCDPDAEWLPVFRQDLRSVMLELELLPNWKEHYPDCETLPAYLKKAGYPSMSVNRFVAWKSELKIPDRTTLLNQIKTRQSKRGFSWRKAIKNHLSFIMAVCIAFFPKCPFCWAAYMSLAAAWGIKTISYQPWLLPVFCVLLVLNIISLYMTRKRHHYGPLILSLAGAFLVISNRYWFETQAIMYIGVGFLIMGSLWNSLSRRMANSVKHYLFGWAR